MSEFGENAGPFLSNLLRSIQKEAERLPSASSIAESLKEFDPTPEQIHDLTEKCAEAVTVVGNAVADMFQRLHESGPEPKIPDHIDIPDDLSDLDK